ncbi:isovaleryl-CoA dehydrogenase 1 [Hibiscus syriacus]|uniref:Isovaleryl-CoA dehydrogenase 1 n=1 Tax=Hibiscus syriacus TaxID=106335 RepID=A0A6A2YH02_HIBSY|nr:isovaleryl-CoA dehydrogenase 1 [Hibiscus syriacus]
MRTGPQAAAPDTPITGFVSPLNGLGTVNRPLDYEMQSPAHHQSLASTGIEKSNISDYMRVSSTAYAGFAESNRFPKVLQGQEICPLRSLTQKADLNLGAWAKTNLGCNSYEFYKTDQEPMASSYPSPLLRGNVSFNASSIKTGVGVLMDGEPTGLQRNVAGFKLFGFSLNVESPNPSSQNSGKRSCIKVHKQGSLVGRALDPSKLYGYDDLVTELECLFGMEGFLSDPDKGWRFFYTVSENVVMVVGDDPWHEFCDVVSKIHIYTQEEVEKMTIGRGSDDTQSCLEQAPVIMEASKSSSVGQPDSSSPTVVKDCLFVLMLL